MLIVISPYLSKHEAYYYTNGVIEVAEGAHPICLAHELAHVRRGDNRADALSVDELINSEVATWQLTLNTWQGRIPKALIKRCLLTYVQGCKDKVNAAVKVSDFLVGLDKAKKPG